MQLKLVISNPSEGLIIKLYTKLEEKRNVYRFCSALIILFFFFPQYMRISGLYTLLLQHLMLPPIL